MIGTALRVVGIWIAGSVALAGIWAAWCYLVIPRIRRGRP